MCALHKPSITWDQAVEMAEGFTASGIGTTIHVRADNLSTEDIAKADEACIKGVKGLQIMKAPKESQGRTIMYYKIRNGMA